jgi:hypothetical protein
MLKCYTLSPDNYKAITEASSVDYSAPPPFPTAAFAAINRSAQGMTIRAIKRAMALGAALAVAAAANATADEQQVTRTVPTSAVVARILVCPATIAPADCDANNALDVIAGPPATSEIGCGVLSQQMLAVFGTTVTDGQYVKIGCVRRAERAD